MELNYMEFSENSKFLFGVPPRSAGHVLFDQQTAFCKFEWLFSFGWLVPTFSMTSYTFFYYFKDGSGTFFVSHGCQTNQMWKAHSLISVHFTE